MSNYVLDKAYQIQEAGGIAAGVVVAPGEDEASCRIATANDTTVLGASVYTQPREGGYVPVRRLGIASIIAAGPVVRGQRVRVANSEGHVAGIPLPRYTTGSTGSNNALIIEIRDPRLFSAGFAIELHDPEAEVPFSWSWQKGALRLVLASDDVEPIQTANALIASVEDDSTLSQLFAIRNATGSNGTGVVGAGTLHVSNIAELRLPIGIAESDAAHAGDIIEVLLSV